MTENSLITVFTPAYNRADLLKRCYKSLQEQSSKNFKWLIIDDGSKDNTGQLVEEWIKQEKDFAIEYEYKTNGGLHTGYNAAIEIIDTELCVCVDSDDWMPSDAIEKIEGIWNQIKSKNYAGFMGLDFFADGNCVGDRFPDGIREMYLYEKLVKYKIAGDKKMVYRTEVMKKVAPMPVFEGEKNFNPSYMMYQADQYGKMYVVNECFCIVEYQPEGMSNSMLKQYFNSPLSFAEIRKQYMGFPGASKIFLFKQNIHYVSSCYLSRRLKYAVKESPKKIYTCLAFPLGILLGMYVQKKQT